MASTTTNQPGFLLSKHSVKFPSHPAFWYNDAEFEQFILKRAVGYQGEQTPDAGDVEDATTSSLINEDVDSMRGLTIQSDTTSEQQGKSFLQALHSKDEPDRDMSNMTRTANNDLAFQKTEPLVDLFFALNGTNTMESVSKLLDQAWSQDSLTTLKIVFNTRSIHLGKSSKTGLYQCIGWLAQNHPKTLLLNLKWLCRPVLEKKVGEKRKREDEDDAVIVELEKSSDDPSRFDVKHGVSHGYWKDLTNILVLAIEQKFGNSKNVLNFKDHGKPAKREWDPEKAQIKRHTARDERQSTATQAFENDFFYTALHLTVARLFAAQLKLDLSALRSDDKKANRSISLCAKWAPSSRGFHDKHTYLVSTISELLHPQSEYPSITDREIYLRHAREAYRKDVSALRTKLGVVEQKIAAKKFEDINYDRVPSIAMSKTAHLFIKKDYDRFDQYLTQVAQGQKKISGAVLLPSTLVSKVIKQGYTVSQKGTRALVEGKTRELELKVVDSQWETLVQRIKESGKMVNAIAVCDVSGSMSYPTFSDGSCPMDSSIGLSMLLAEVTAPPFGGSFITFSSNPSCQKIEGSNFQARVQNLQRADWAMNTDLEKVFSGLILPIAKKHKVSQDDMVKKVFVFSDMEFDAATVAGRPFSTSFERIKDAYQQAKYDMPEIVFWNLAAGADGSSPKPVQSTEEGVQLVSGYSQGLLKMFLDNGSFVDPDVAVEVETEVVINSDGEEVAVQVNKKEKADPMSTVRKAVGHEAYAMLMVFD